MKILKQKSLESSKESGEEIVSNVNQAFFTKEKERNLKRAMTIKFIICLVLTNYMTYSFVDLSTKEEGPKVVDKSMTEVAISLELYLDTSQNKKTISIYKSNDELLIKEALLLKKLEERFDGKQRYLIRVKKEELLKLRTHKDQVLYAYPYTNSSNQQREIYEFDI